MLSLSNALTLLRLPAAFMFIIDNMTVRLAAIALAMLSDCLDGYFARKNKTVSQLGTILDPIMDKFFVFFSLGILVATSQMPVWGMVCMLSRDICLFIFGIYLTLSRGWDQFEFKSIVWGKITTSAQFLVLIFVVIQVQLPWYIYAAFIPLGMLTALGLYRGFKKSTRP